MAENTTIRTESTGVGFRSRSKAAFVDMGSSSVRAAARQIRGTIPTELFKYMPWAPWGDDNLQPQRMVLDIDTCGILNTIIDQKARYGICEGFVPAIMRRDETGRRVVDHYLEDAEIEDFLEDNNAYLQGYAWMKDVCGWNLGVGRFMLNKGGDRITNFQRDDLSEVRFDRKNPRTGISERLWYSADWQYVRGERDERVFSVPLINPNAFQADLVRKAAAGMRELAFTFANPGWGKHYYPTSPWMPVHLWVKIAQGIPEMKAALYENAMRPKYIVVINEDFWEKKYGMEWPLDDPKAQERLRQKFYDEVDEWLVGAENAHKSIFTQGYRDAEGKTWTDIEIKSIPDNTTQGELLPDSAAANSEISIGMAWNLGINGGNQKSGLYEQNQGGSNIREGALNQVIQMEPERQHLRRLMKQIIKFNQWDKKHPGLEIIIPATVLTTTDTGHGTKSVLTGGDQPGEKKKKEGSQ